MENTSMLIVIGGALLLVILIGFGLMRNPSSATSTENIQSESTESVESVVSESNKRWENPPTMRIDVNKKYMAQMETTKGNMSFELYTNETPLTVNNFIFLSKENFYDNTRFHRIIKDFMIQGGDPKGDGTGGPGYKFEDESITRDYTRGTLAMANSGEDTNGSQFFIMTKDTPLPKNYVIFGKLISGDDTLDAIASTSVVDNGMGEVSSPTEDVLIKSITITEQ